MSDDLQNLEKLYDPLQWVKRHPIDVALEKHLAFAEKENAKPRQTIPSKLNIAYGPLEKEKFDIFGTDLSGTSPVLVFIHGGYWQMEELQRGTTHFIATNLYKNGVKTIFIGYELAPKVTVDEIVEEVETAIEKSVEYAVHQGSRGIYLAGFSVGAHLAASLFAKSSKFKHQNLIKAVFLLGGIYNLTTLIKTTVNDALKLDAESARRLSPYFKEFYKGRFFIVTGTLDSPEFQKESHALHEKLKNAGVSTQLLILNDVDHLELAELLNNPQSEVSKLLLNVIFDKSFEAK